MPVVHGEEHDPEACRQFVPKVRLVQTAGDLRMFEEVGGLDRPPDRVAFLVTESGHVRSDHVRVE